MSCPLLVWKEEPESPLSLNEASLDATLYQTPLDEFGAKLEADLAFTKFEDANVASPESHDEDLADLEDIINLELKEFIKIEPFLLDGNILDVVEPPRAIPVTINDLKKEYKPDDTQYYLSEFNTVYEEVGLTHNALTPPQSPPNNQPLLANLEPLLVQLPFSPPQTKLQFKIPEKQLLTREACGPLPVAMEMVSFNNFSESVVPNFQPEMDQSFNPGLAVDELEELVRTTAEDMQWSSSSCHSSSPGSPGGSSSSNFGDCSSDDPEWIPDTLEDNRPDNIGKVPRKRRAYTKGAPEEKKVRKKEQNKNAATRYRMKKKAEVEVILSEERELAKHHDDLETKIVDLNREIKYLKGLMRDLFKAKGLIN